MSFIYRVHSIERMFQREIDLEVVELAVLDGEIIEQYPQDKPYGSFLNLYFNNDEAIHVVYSKNEEDDFIIITVYKPSLLKWKKDYKTRKLS